MPTDCGHDRCHGAAGERPTPMATVAGKFQEQAPSGRGRRRFWYRRSRRWTRSWARQRRACARRARSRKRFSRWPAVLGLFSRARRKPESDRGPRRVGVSISAGEGEPGSLAHRKPGVRQGGEENVTGGTCETIRRISVESVLLLGAATSGEQPVIRRIGQCRGIGKAVGSTLSGPRHMDRRRALSSGNRLECRRISGLIEGRHSDDLDIVAGTTSPVSGNGDVV